MDKNNSIRTLRMNLVLIFAVWAKIHEKWLEIGNFDDSIRIFILKWGTFFILMRRYPLYIYLGCETCRGPVFCHLHLPQLLVNSCRLPANEPGATLLGARRKSICGRFSYAKSNFSQIQEGGGGSIKNLTQIALKPKNITIFA